MLGGRIYILVPLTSLPTVANINPCSINLSFQFLQFSLFLRSIFFQILLTESTIPSFPTKGFPFFQIRNCTWKNVTQEQLRKDNKDETNLSSAFARQWILIHKHELHKTTINHCATTEKPSPRHIFQKKSKSSWVRQFPQGMLDKLLLNFLEFLRKVLLSKGLRVKDNQRG